jgi:hypothetical protein
MTHPVNSVRLRAAGAENGEIVVEKIGHPPEAIPRTIIRHSFIGTNKGMLRVWARRATASAAAWRKTPT